VVTQTKSEKRWRATTALANADPLDERGLNEQFMKTAIVFGACNRVHGRPVHEYGPESAKSVRTILPELRDLLRALATADGRKQAEHIVAKHENREVRPWNVISRPKGKGWRITFDAPWPRSVIKGKGRMLTRGHAKDRFGLQRAIARDLLALICRFARREVLDKERLLGAVRVCERPECRRFFVRQGFFAHRAFLAQYGKRRKRYKLRRGGRGLFCSERCKSRCRPPRADEMYERRARSLRGRAAQKSMDKLKRRKLAPSRKRRLLAILRGLL
jgi:hypothetical protein